MNARLQTFVAAVDDAVSCALPEPELLSRVQAAMRELVAIDDWLPAWAAQPHPQYYQQYCLHVDPQQRFSVVSFVWGPDQQTPVHDHTVWGAVGMLRGAEVQQQFRLDAAGLQPSGPEERLAPGDAVVLSPRTGDIHRVANAFGDRSSISIHVYGADIGHVRRHVFDPETGRAKEFVSGYSTPAEISR